MAIQQRLEAEATEAEAALKPALNTDAATETEVIEGAATQEEPKDWKKEAELNKQRFKVLQGKYNAESKRYREKITALESAEQAPKSDDEFDNESLDEDFPEFAAVRKANEELANKVDKMEEERNQDAFNSQLTELIPDWKQVDVNPDFLQWLGTTDEVIGEVRQTLIDEAVADGDVNRIAAIINTWRATQHEEAEADPQQPPQQYEAPSNSAGNNSVSTGNTYTETQVNVFYDDLAKGRYRGREVERLQIEKELDSAMAQGRIVQG